MKRILLSTLFVMAMISSTFADEVSFVASAPKTVEVGQRFKIEFKVNSRTDGQPTLPEIDGLEILMGPSTSRASSTQIINGRKTFSESTTFTYMVKLHKEGDITIPAASVIVKGKTYTSNPLTIVSSASADEVSFVASAPKTVEVGTQFRIEFKVNSWTDGQSALPEIDGLEILYGPGISRASSTQIINGQKTLLQSTTFFYVVKLNKEGDITIPAASVIVEGKTYTSNPLTITVLPKGQILPSSQQDTDSTNIADDKLFIRAEVNKAKVYEHETLVLTYKLYWNNVRYRYGGISAIEPKLKGFNIQKVELPNEPQPELVPYNGHYYYMSVVGEYILSPHEIGKLEIPAVECEVLLHVETDTRMDPLMMMLNGIDSYITVIKKLKSNKITIEVDKATMNASEPDGENMTNKSPKRKSLWLR